MKQRLVLKLGTNVLTHGGTNLDLEWLKQLAQAIKQLHNQHEVIIVCSGAGTTGKQHVQLTSEEKSKYTKMARRQLYAAVGQPYLMHALINVFSPLDITLGQALLTRNTFSELNRYYNTTAVLKHMLEENIVPIINGNDVITTLELSSGGNDGLAAVIAIALNANRLILLTNTDGVYDKNPFSDTTAQKFDTVKSPDVLLKLISNQVSDNGIGGMHAKVEAARLAWYAGIPTLIANGMNISVYPLLADVDPPGTLFIPPVVPNQSEQTKIRWFLSARNNFGSVVVDASAEQAIKERNSLLSVDVKDVKGQFRIDDIISVENETGQIIACGLVKYSAGQLRAAQKDGRHLNQPIIHANQLKLLYV